ncbi:MAG: AAA family ATPase [Gemmatimonadetes bacterium]|nr:AAA family ATPase [Gemmatimonadota bacterium]
MRIVRFTAENVKKLKAVEITPEGNVVHLTGPNGAGKSSVLDAIWMALAGAKAIPSHPVREGEESARIRLDLGELVVTRKFKRDGASQLTVESEKGARFPSPQAMLDSLVGSLAFDPLAFSRMEPKAQLETLRRLVPLAEDLDALDRENALDYQTRTERNRVAKDLEAQIAAVPVDPSLPEQPIDEAALLARMEGAAQHNTQLEQRKAKRAALAQSITARLTEAAELRARADALTREAGEDQAKLDRAETLPEPIDTAELRRAIEQARRVNQNVEQQQRKDALVRRLAEVLTQAQLLTEAIADRSARKQAAIAAAPMPVDGLGFGDGEVLYRGLPLAQASSAEQLRVSVAIAMAANPKLRVLRVKDGGLLDESSLALLHGMAEAHDYQVWIETAGTHRPGIVMEDGAVKQLAEAVA